MGLRWHGTAANGNIAAVDPARLARWWAEVLGVRVLHERPDVVEIPGLTFVKADRPKQDFGGHHFELDSDDLGADVEKLVDMGARHVDIGQGSSSRVVLADPEGNEFWLIPPQR